MNVAKAGNQGTYNPKCYDITWAIPHRLLVVTLPSHLDLDDWQDLDEEVLTKLDASQARADIVVNADKLTDRSINIQSLKAAFSFLYHANFNRLLVIGSSKQMQSRISVICSKSNREVRFLSTLIEAMAVLRNIYEAQV